MRFLLHVYRLCGRWPFRFLLFIVLLWFYARRRLAREASRDYLQRLHDFSGGSTPKPTQRNVFRHFIAFSEIILDRLLVAGPPSLTDSCRVDGVEHIDTLVEQNRGAIIVTAHFGNTDLCRKLGERHSRIRISVLAHTGHSHRFERLLREIDPNYDFDLIHVDNIGVETAIAMKQRIAAGGFIVITGDRVPVNNTTATVRVPFLGSDADFPISPYVLAEILQCPLLAVFGFRHHDDFVITVRQVADSISLPRRTRKAAVVPYVTTFAKLLEAECLKAPFQWSNFFPFWAPPDVTKETH